MHVLVCIKQVPADPSAVKVDRKTNTLIREGIPVVVNPFDLFAIEEALRLRERMSSSGQKGRVSVITMGPPQARSALEEAIAMGADDAVLLSDRAFAGADTLATAYTLSRGIRRIEDSTGAKVDIVICGRQSTDGDTAQVGPELAEMLGIPHLVRVRKVESLTRESIRVERIADGGYDVIESCLPVLLTVEKGINQPRVPSLRGLMRARKAGIPVWGAQELGVEAQQVGLAGSPTRVIRVFSPERQRRAEMLTGSPEAVARLLVDRLMTAM
ncbi:MAG TPA: electron transfer flavoprotein subunit beta/FixA family protein [Firmicutes bacterium]|nr:electron transfer flavoprotein subunit beta/FixA family protein [Bacillota bacterium]